MDFVLWVSRAMHVIAAVVWLGGLIFLNAVLNPILRHQDLTQTDTALAITRRFAPFLSFGVWTILATGIFLMILSPRFRWLDVTTLWSQLLFAKAILFGALVFFSWQIKSVLGRLASIDGADYDGWWRSLERLIQRSVIAGLGVFLCAAGMAVV